MKLIFQFKQVDGPIIASGSGFAVSRHKMNIRFINGYLVCWRPQHEYQKLNKRIL